MIVNFRADLTDEQRNILARMIKPSAPRRLATRMEVSEYLEGCIAALQDPEPLQADVSRRPRMDDLIARARAEDRHQLAGKSDGFVIGWCKVKYSQQLRPGA